MRVPGSDLNFVALCNRSNHTSYSYKINQNNVLIFNFTFRGKIATISPRAMRKLEGLNGPTYRLNEKHHPLPPPNALKVKNKYKLHRVIPQSQLRLLQRFYRPGGRRMDL